MFRTGLREHHRYTTFGHLPQNHTMEIKVITGELTGKGQYVLDQGVTIYFYLELKDAEGKYHKLVNAAVGAECDRPLGIGNTVTVAYAYTPDIPSNHQPGVPGVCFVYGVHSSKSNRVFDDVGRWQHDVTSIESSLSTLKLFYYGLLAFIIGCWMVGKAPTGLALLGLALSAIPYGIFVKPVKRMRNAMASAAEIRPAMETLHSKVKAASASEATVSAG